MPKERKRSNAQQAQLLLQQGKPLHPEALVGWRITFSEPQQGIAGGIVVKAMYSTGAATRHLVMRLAHRGYVVVNLKRKPERGIRDRFVTSSVCQFKLEEHIDPGPTKRGFVHKRALKSGKNWRKRLFIINPYSGALYYYRSDRNAVTATPRGVFELCRPNASMQVRLLEPEDDGADGRLHVVEVYSERSKDNRMIFAASSAAVADSWVTALEEAIAHHAKQDANYTEEQLSDTIASEADTERRATLRQEQIRLAALGGLESSTRMLNERMEQTVLEQTRATPWDASDTDLLAQVRAAAATLRELVEGTISDDTKIRRSVQTNAMWTAVEALSEPKGASLKDDLAELVRECLLADLEMHAGIRKRAQEVGPLYTEVATLIERAYEWLDAKTDGGASLLDASKGTDTDAGTGNTQLKPSGTADTVTALDRAGLMFLDDSAAGGRCYDVKEVIASGEAATHKTKIVEELAGTSATEKRAEKKKKGATKKKSKIMKGVEGSAEKGNEKEAEKAAANKKVHKTTEGENSGRRSRRRKRSTSTRTSRDARTATTNSAAAEAVQQTPKHQEISTRASLQSVVAEVRPSGARADSGAREKISAEAEKEAEAEQGAKADQGAEVENEADAKKGAQPKK